MRRGGADVLLLAAERPGAELALREMRSLGLRWPVLGGDALTGIEADGALAEGMRLSSAYLPDRRDERSEERRVGKECRSGWWPEHEKKQTETQIVWFEHRSRTI